MATHRYGGNAAADAEFAVMLKEGRGYAECYDALAPALYQYCWSLVGPGRIGRPVGQRAREEGGPRAAPEPEGACAAVHETFLIAVDQLGQLRDRHLFRAWLFALARNACEQLGFNESSPYAALATVRVERPLVEALLHLPPSHRDLLELYLRHQMPPGQIGLILGLDSDLVDQLCRAAVRRIAEHLPDRDDGAPWHLAEVAALFELLPPPQPPRGLRELIITECGDEASAHRRRAAAESVEPLGPNGFPPHRRRASSAQAPAGASRGAVSAGAGAADEANRLLSTDLTATRDVTGAQVGEPVAELAPDPGHGRPISAEQAAAAQVHGRWAAPVIAGLCTIAAAVLLWAAGNVLAGPNGSTVMEGPAPTSSRPVEDAEVPEVPGERTPGSVAGPSPAAVGDGESGTGADDASIQADTEEAPALSAEEETAASAAPETDSTDEAAEDSGGSAEDPELEQGVGSGGGTDEPSPEGQQPPDGEGRKGFADWIDDILGLP